MRRPILSTALFAAVSLAAFAQTSTGELYAGFYPPAPEYQQLPPPQTESSQSQAAPRLSQAELSNLVAPIALYPDMLLSQVLAASTYPTELMQARQWMDANRGLSSAQLVDAARQQSWDASVQALVAFPDVMNLLTRDIQWTTDVGNAFLSQQAGVMDAIQQLRVAARDRGHLEDTPQQRIAYQEENGQDAMVIEPADPQVVYPPVYNPEYVWGQPEYGAYPDLGYPDAADGIGYGVGTALGTLFSGLWNFGGWGWGLNWLTHGLFLNNLFFGHFGFGGSRGDGFYTGRFGGYGYGPSSAWVHDPYHRHGVPYTGGNRVGGWNRFHAAYDPQRFSGRWNSGSRQRDAYRRLSESSTQYGTFGFGSGFQNNGFNRSVPAYRGGSFRDSPRNFRDSARGGFWDSPRGGGTPGYRDSRSYGRMQQPDFRNSFSRDYSRGDQRSRGWFGRLTHPSVRPHSSEPRSPRGFSAPHFSAPKSSGHFGGGGHGGFPFGGHSAGGHGGGRSYGGGGGHGGGGRSHGGSHKRR